MTIVQTESALMPWTLDHLERGRPALPAVRVDKYAAQGMLAREASCCVGFINLSQMPPATSLSGDA